MEAIDTGEEFQDDGDDSDAGKDPSNGMGHCLAALTVIDIFIEARRHDEI